MWKWLIVWNLVRAIEHPTYSALTRPLCELSSLLPPQVVAAHKKIRVSNFVSIYLFIYLSIKDCFANDWYFNSLYHSLAYRTYWIFCTLFWYLTWEGSHYMLKVVGKLKVLILNRILIITKICLESFKYRGGRGPMSLSQEAWKFPT